MLSNIYNYLLKIRQKILLHLIFQTKEDNKITTNLNKTTTMGKEDITRILKNGNNFRLQTFNTIDKNVAERFKEAKNYQELSKERKVLDWEKIESFRIKMI
jgi:hypothetical protein